MPTISPVCGSGYILNPVSSTCLRLVEHGWNWSAAKSNCEARGETLAVFTSEESVKWIREFIRSQPRNSGVLIISQTTTCQVWCRHVGQDMLPVARSVHKLQLA